MQVKLSWSFLLFVAFACGCVEGWENGLARTPPMGWLSWLRFACTTDCVKYPDGCINEQLYKTMIDHLVSDGWLSLGYDRVNIDDCWMEKFRDPMTNRLVADGTRFPTGIRHLADYAHSRRVLLGINEDVGTATCAQHYPATYASNGTDYTEIDAQTFSDWAIDSLKLNGCNQASSAPYRVAYPRYTQALKKQKHKIMNGCSWPLFAGFRHVTTRDYETIRENCNSWRNYESVLDSWESVRGIIEFYREHSALFAKYHGPGGWFDPDMLTIGNEGLSYEQSRTQMAFWCLWSAPLLMSNDLRTIKPEYKAILQNRHLIAVDQDPLGIMGQPAVQERRQQVWVKKLSPTAGCSCNPNPYAILYYNWETIGNAAVMSHKLSKLIPELKSGINYSVHDLFAEGAKLETLTADSMLTLRVSTSGAVRLVKIIPE